jgi:hypothetical protein
MIAVALLTVAGVLDLLDALLRRVGAFFRSLGRRRHRTLVSAEQLHAALIASGCELSEGSLLRTERDWLYAERAQLLEERAAERGRVHHPLKHPIIVTTIEELMPHVVEVSS